MSNFLKRSSSLIIGLLLFIYEYAYGLPLTKTCYTLPQESMELYLAEELTNAYSLYRRDIIDLNVGITNNTSFGVVFAMLNEGFALNNSETGDLFFGIWHYIGRYAWDRVDAGIKITFRLPTGPDPHGDYKWAGLSSGREELILTPVFDFLISSSELISINLNYIFREENSDGLYNSLRFNLKNKQTYKSIFGLNPFYEGSFLNRKSLANDYIKIGGAFLERRFSPILLFAEISYAFTDFKRDNEISLLEGESGDSMTVSMGLKYIARENLFFQLYGGSNPLYRGNGIKNFFGIALNVIF